MPTPLRSALWAETEDKFQKAQERYTKVLSNRQVKVEEEDTSADYSAADLHSYKEAFTASVVDTNAWRKVVHGTAQYFAQIPFVYHSQVRFALTDANQFLVKSDGSRLQQGHHYLRLILNISGMADDGMELERSEVYSAAGTERLPDEATVMKTAERLVQELQALIHAPMVDPFIGPAILVNRASGVFFHEIFGHRIEGHRQKSSEEGQTFTKKLNQQILPSFISVYDDPTSSDFQKHRPPGLLSLR